MVHTKVLEGITEPEGFVARAIICHDAGDSTAKAVVISDCVV